MDLSALRWTVDEPADFVLVESIYQALYPANPALATADVLRLLAERPTHLGYSVELSSCTQEHLG